MPVGSPAGAAAVDGVGRVHFGGPDHPPGRLRDLLAERVDAVPPGGTIDWVTYYFRDRRLAEGLLRARRRGVRVRLTLEGRPRTAHANDAVVKMLSGADGLGEGLRRVVHRRVPAPSRLSLVHPHLHEKLYCFSHPRPTAMVGSFNPSGDQPEEDPAVIEEIGDQDRGHNLLVEFTEPLLVRGLVEHSRRLHGMRHGRLERLAPGVGGGLQQGPVAVQFKPGWRRDLVVEALRGCGTGSRVRIAASHLKGRTAMGLLRALVRRGAQVEILAEATWRRVPPYVEALAREAGIPFRRLVHPEGLPMHNKFVLVEREGERLVGFGSGNWTSRSLWLNHEIVVLTGDPAIHQAFELRWERLASL